MSKIERLIKEKCPNGVPFYKIKDIVKVTIGEFVHKNRQSDDSPYPVYNGGTSNTGFYDEYNNDGHKVIISARGANAGFINRVEGKYWAGNSCYTLNINSESKLNWNYLYYYLKNNQASLLGVQQTGSIPAISKKQVEDFKIAIPPIEVQEEIVRILDQFSKLETELEAELEARKSQYKFWHEKLFDFDKNVEEHTLEELCNIVDYRGKTPKKVKSGIFLVTAKNIKMGYIDYEYSKEYIAESDFNNVMRRGKANIGDVLFTTEAPCGHVAQVDKDNIALAQRVIKYSSKDLSQLSNEYLKYALLSNQFQNKLLGTSTGGTVKGIKGSKLHKLTIPIPNIEKQKKIVNILDKFDKLVNDIAEGLPAEIEARRKQYEYYRNKLLSFEEVSCE